MSVQKQKDSQRAKLDADIQQYLDAGGTIKHCTSADNAGTPYKISKSRKEVIAEQKRLGTLTIANNRGRRAEKKWTNK